VKIGDKVRAIRDFSVGPFFDEGSDVKKGIIWFVQSLDQDGGGKLPSTSMWRLVAVRKKGTSYYSFRSMRLSRCQSRYRMGVPVQ